MEVLLGNLLDFLAHGSGEEEGLVGLGQCAEDGVDAVGESHVEHLVGLVEYYVGNVVEVCLAALHEVNEPAGGGDDNLCAVSEGAYLVGDAGAAIHGHDIDALQVLGEVAEVVGNLQAELAGGGEDDNLRGALPGVDHLQQRQSEGGSLSRSCLCKGYERPFPALSFLFQGFRVSCFLFWGFRRIFLPLPGE